MDSNDIRPNTTRSSEDAQAHRPTPAISGQGISNAGTAKS